MPPQRSMQRSAGGPRSLARAAHSVMVTPRKTAPAATAGTTAHVHTMCCALQLTLLLASGVTGSAALPVAASDAASPPADIAGAGGSMPWVDTVHVSPCQCQWQCWHWCSSPHPMLARRPSTN